MQKDTYLFDVQFLTEPRSIYDGDTVRVDIDLGFDMWMRNQSVRLYGIDTPEVRGAEKEEGLVVRDYVRGRLLGQSAVMQTFKGDEKGKYGRWLGIIWLNGMNFNKHLIDEGYAEQDFYGDPIPKFW